MISGFDHFSHLAPFYDRAIPFKAIESLVANGQLIGDELVLDAGGGTGRVAEALSPYVRRVVIADLSKGMLVQADRKGLDTLLSPVESLPFQNGIFDRVVMIDALHHVLDHRKAADEMWRTLAPGGIIIIQEPDIRRSSVKVVAVVEKITLMRSHFLTPIEIKSLFRDKAGEVSQIDEGFSTWILVKKPL